uniref:Uncharacterized protein n=1 Tax=Panagrolaimus sp. PS1159 TaxID=55785 RepID=A0AC35ESZ2_9BILA
MPNDYQKLPILKDVEASIFDAEKKEPKLAFKKMLKTVLIWTCLFSMSVWIACFTWTLGHSFTKSNVKLEKPLMDENCLVTYLLGIENLLESPEYFVKEDVKKLKDYAILERFAHHQSARNEYYIIDPIYFLGILFIITTTIEIYHLLCCYVYKKNGFTSRFLLCFHVYYCTLFAIFIIDALIYASQLDDPKFFENCRNQFINY